jgi:hypothetical protein
VKQNRVFEGGVKNSFYIAINIRSVATVVMVLYMITYCTLTALELVMYITCPDDTLGFEVVGWLLSHIKLCLYAIF